MKPLRSRRNLMPLVLKLTILKQNSKPIFPMFMTKASALNRSWKTMQKLMSTMPNFKNSSNKPAKMLNLKISSNYREETTNLLRNVSLI